MESIATAEINGANAAGANAVSSAIGSFRVMKLEDATKLELSAEQYLVRKIERNTGIDSSACVIPAVTAEQFVAALENSAVFEAAQSWFQGVVGEVVKSRMTAGRDVIIESDFSLVRVAEYLSEQEVKEGRISKEKITKWFDASLVEALNAAFSEKLGTQYTEQVKEGVLEGYRKQFARLSGKDLTLEVEVKGSLLKACSLAPEDSAIRKYCEGKIKEAKLPSAVLALL